jgi:hypothetical protein
MAQVRIREVVGTLRVVDGESLLTPPLLERIVSAVLEAVRDEHRDEASRRRDTHVGACCDSCAGGGGGHA